MIGVLGIEDLVRRTEDVCNRTLPTSYKRYAGSANGCRERNVTQNEAMERQKRALEQVQKSLELAQMQVENQQKMIALLEQSWDQGRG